VHVGAGEQLPLWLVQVVLHAAGHAPFDAPLSHCSPDCTMPSPHVPPTTAPEGPSTTGTEKVILQPPEDGHPGPDVPVKVIVAVQAAVVVQDAGAAPAFTVIVALVDCPWFNVTPEGTETVTHPLPEL
jgi:hypothetical protein